MIKKLTTLALLLASINCSAQVWEGGLFKIQSLRLAPDGVYVRFNPAPTACQGGTQYGMHARFLYTQADAKTMTAELLAAYTSRDTLKGIWVSNEGTPCSVNGQILNLDMFEMT